MAWNPISNLVEDSIENFMTNLASQAINAFLEFLNAINGSAIAILDMDIVVQGMALSQLIAGTILGVKFMFELWLNHMLRQNGDSDGDPAAVVMRMGEAAAVLMSIPWIVRQAYVWGTQMAADVVTLPGVTPATMGPTIVSTMTGGINSSTFPVAIAIAVIFALVLLIIILIQTFIRAAELAIAAVVGSFMALGLTNSSSQAFQGWWREVLNLALAQPLQLFLIKCSFFSLLNFNMAEWIRVLLFCGFLWVTYKSPTTLKQYVYSTGVGKATGGAASQAGSMMIMRKMMTKGAA